jgi:hypothetical protein
MKRHKHWRIIIKLELIIIRPESIEQATKQSRQFVIIIVIKLVSEQLVFQQSDIQLFLLLFLKEYIQSLYRGELEEHTQFGIQQHNSQSLFFL